MRKNISVEFKKNVLSQAAGLLLSAQSSASAMQSHPLKPCGYVPVDMDVSPFDNSKISKEGVSRTLKSIHGVPHNGTRTKTGHRTGKEQCLAGSI